MKIAARRDFRVGPGARRARALLACGTALLLLLGPGDRANAAAAAAPSRAAGPHLPAAPPPIGPLLRGPDGQIELVTPQAERQAGERLCDPGALCVGAGEAYPSLGAALKAVRRGGTIEIIGGIYREADTVAVADVSIRGVAGRPHFDCTGLALAANAACVAIAAPGVTLANLEVSGAASGGDAACIRAAAGTTFTLRNIVCHDSRSGILSAARSAVIDNSEFYDNGGAGDARNAWFGGDCDRVVVRGSVFRDAREGDAFVSSCRATSIADSTFDSATGGRDINLPDGGDTLVYRSSLGNTEDTASDDIVSFATASCRYPADLVLRDVTIRNQRQNATIRNSDRCLGHAIVFEHVTVKGMPLRALGYIIRR